MAPTPLLLISLGIAYMVLWSLAVQIISFLIGALPAIMRKSTPKKFGLRWWPAIDIFCRESAVACIRSASPWEFCSPRFQPQCILLHYGVVPWITCSVIVCLILYIIADSFIGIFIIDKIIHKYRRFQKMSYRRFLKAVLVVLGFLALASSVVDRTYYIYLGLDITATQAQIQNAYNQKKTKIQALQDGEAKDKKLGLLKAAYQVLGNEKQRMNYDRLNKDLITREKVVANLKKITKEHNRKDRTMKITLPVSVEDVYLGRTVEAQYLKKTACTHCKGTGADTPKSLKTCSKCGGDAFSIQQAMNMYGQNIIAEATCPVCQGWGKQVVKVCPHCHGSKLASKLENVKIKIPAGLPDGNVIKIPNFGDEPVTGAPADLEVTIIQIPTQKWSRKNNDLIYKMQISLKDSILGFQKTFKHLNEQEIKVIRSSVTSKDTVVNYAGMGIKNTKTGTAGNLIVKFQIKMEELTNRQLDMWEEFFETHNKL